MFCSADDGDVLQAGAKFLPWVGDSYKDCFEGIRLLILGESQYDSAKRDRSIRDAGTTRAGVTWYIEPTTSFKFATNVQHLAMRRPVRLEERDKFWNSVAHYNYIQDFVGKEARVQASAEMWAAARTPLLAVLRILDPQAVLVLGYDTWSHLRDFPEGPLLPDKAGLGTCPGRVLPAGGGEALAFHTMHPSASISPPDWYDRVAEGLRAAATHRKSRT